MKRLFAIALLLAGADGTSFNVEAYGNETPISTTLIKGSVGFIYKNNKGKFQKSMLSPRQKLVYSPQTGDIKCYVTSGESEISWKDGKLIFNDTEGKHGAAVRKAALKALELRPLRGDLA